MIEKLLKIFTFPFKKLKVFHQILIIIAIMTIFLALQGLYGLNAIGTTEKDTRKMFLQSMEGTVGVMLMSQTVNRIQSIYLDDYFSSTSFRLSTFTGIKSQFASTTGNLKKYYKEDCELIERELDKIERVIKLPVNIENLQELRKITSIIEIAINNISKKIQDETAASMSVGNSFLSGARWVSSSILIFGVIIATLIALSIAFFIARPLKLMLISANALADGDLTKTIPVEGSIEVAGVIGSLNKAIYSLRELVGGIDEQSNMLYIASQELKDASDETGKSATEVARAMEELSRGSSEQADQTTEAVKNINVLSGLVRKVSKEMKNISSDSQIIAQSAQLGQKATGDVTSEIVQIYDMTKDVTVVIDELDKTSDEISEITTVIEGIAEQTTLLALNAAIEAARAGEHGKGFAVVAKETGKLAEQSKQAAQLISSLINQMKQRTDQAVRSMARGMTMVESGKNLASEASVTFENIFNKLENILSRIDSVALSAKQMAESNESVIFAVTSIAALSEESMASTQEVSATAEEQSASVQQVTALAENLADISSRLKQSVAQFELNEHA